ncbi:MAG: hypothetical protein ACE5HO_21900, partial [bacterium]
SEQLISEPVLTKLCCWRACNANVIVYEVFQSGRLRYNARNYQLRRVTRKLLLVLGIAVVLLIAAVLIKTALYPFPTLEKQVRAAAKLSLEEEQFTWDLPQRHRQFCTGRQVLLTIA